MRRHDGAGMDWAREIYAEMQREDGSEASEECEWCECEEWPRVDFDFDGNDAEEQQETFRSMHEAETQHGGRNDAENLTDGKFFGPHTLNLTRGGLAVPVERTGVSNEAEREVEVSGECFLCGEEGCDCEESRPWKAIWWEVAVIYDLTAEVRKQQQIVSTVSIGLRALAKSRSEEGKRTWKCR